MKLVCQMAISFLVVACMSALSLAVEYGQLGYLFWLVVFVFLIRGFAKFSRWWEEL